MRILYITSGMVQLYPHRYIDQFITEAFDSFDAETRVFQLDRCTDWQQEIVSCVREFAPMYIFTIHGGNLSTEVVHWMQQQGSKVGIWFVDDPYDLDESKHRLYGYDFIFTNEWEAVRVYQSAGCKQVHYLALGTAWQHFYPEFSPAEYRSDLCLIGSPFRRRVELVNGLVKRFPQYHVKVVGPKWLECGLSPQVDLVPHHVEPDEVRRYYNGAKINLNIHRDTGEQYAACVNLNAEGIPAHSPNNRTFDIAACRAFQLVDARPRMDEFYHQGSEMISFQNAEELLNRVAHYMRDEGERVKIAERAYRRTLCEHGFMQRIRQMAGIVEERIKQEIAARFDLGVLVKDDRPQVYLILNGRKHLFPSEEIFFRWGGIWENVQVWTRERVDTVPTGLILEVHDSAER